MPLRPSRPPRVRSADLRDHVGRQERDLNVFQSVGHFDSPVPSRFSRIPRAEGKTRLHRHETPRSAATDSESSADSQESLRLLQHRSGILQPVSPPGPRIAEERRDGSESAHAHAKADLQPNLSGGRPRWRPLAFVVVALVATAIASGVALARSTASRIGNGVVVIKTTLGYQDASAAGTGMVLTTSGEILTNNHVIRGATKITVIVPEQAAPSASRRRLRRGRRRRSLRASGASNLATVTTAESSKVAIGDRITAVGNAGGTGTLTRVTGSVTALQRSIVVNDDSGGAARLTGLVGVDANVVAGDSGGPLLNSAGAVIGMNTAGSTGYVSRYSSDSQAYAIPIAKALSIVRQIEAGRASTRIHIGATSFLGIQVGSSLRNSDSTSSGTVIAGVLRGSPAASAGFSPGDVITAIDGRATSSPNSITAAILAKKPGTKVTIRLTDSSGVERSTTVTLASGPAQ